MKEVPQLNSLNTVPEIEPETVPEKEPGIEPEIESETVSEKESGIEPEIEAGLTSEIVTSGKKPPLIVLTGPTAVGKTNLSIQLAHKIGGEIISADSMQVYKKMNIGTAKIMPWEMDGVPHYLVDEIDPSEAFHVVEFKNRAKRAIEQIYSHGSIPIVVGGTGFYIQALLYDIDFSEHEEEKPYRLELARIEKEQGREYLYQMLQEKDPEYALTVHPNNVKRVIRALEYNYETGNKMSEHNEEQREKDSAYCSAYFVLNQDRSILYDRMNRRVDLMMEQGLLDEVTALYREGYTRDMVSMQAIGYKEFFDYFEGKRTLEETVEQIKLDTRHFAKRQLTWFRREKEVIWLDKGSYSSEENILDEMLRVLANKGIYSKCIS